MEMPTPRVALSLGLVGITGGAIGADPRSQLAWAGSAGFGAAQLNGAAAGVRPRELDRSGRRDVAAIMRRNGLVSSGVDLFIPPRHLVEASHADRALAALTGAIELAADLASLTGGDAVLATALAHGGDAAGAIDAIAARAQSCNVRVADSAWPPLEGVDAASAIGVCVDPASVFVGGSGGDPASAVSTLGDRLAGVRLSDLNGSGRVAPGDGRLDTLAYLVAIETSGFRGRVVVDVRGVRRQEDAATDALERFGAPSANGGGQA